MSRWSTVLCVAAVGCGLYWFMHKKPCSDGTCCKDQVTQTQGGLEALNEFKFQGNEAVLSSGVGDGKLLAQIAEKLPQGTVLGIDSSENLVAEAQKNFSQAKNLSFKSATIEEFASTDKYDLVAGLVANAEKAFANAATIIKPGGKLLVNMPARDDQQLVAKVLASEKWAGKATFQPQAPVEYEKMLAQAGFKDVAVTTNPTSQLFANEQAFIDHVIAWVPAVTGLSGDQAVEFAKDLAQSTREAMKTPATDGHIETTSLVTAISACRC